MINAIKNMLGLTKTIEHQDEVNHYLASNKLKAGLVSNIKILTY